MRFMLRCMRKERRWQGLRPGSRRAFRQLLYGVILPSGAECCIALADLIDGSESAFVQRMNEKAQALGMSSTHFVTCTGLHDAQHYSTVRDIAVLLQVCTAKQRLPGNLYSAQLQCGTDRTASGGIYIL